ncbi:MAG: dethiobiotin synthase, partial [Fusobacterium periodonticum]|nr:dethiobiotin synthase [Fusobacterium periodonticum]
MNFKDFFVIGTDTDVGKTYVSTLLYKALRKHNFQYYKPIQSGCFLRDSKLTAPDVDFLTKFVEIPYDDSMVTYTLKEEVSPHLASEMEGTVIEIENVKKHFENLKKKYSNIIVEGAGGLYVPLIRDKFYIYDLIKMWNLPVVLVCGTRVGSINHTMLTLNALNT